MQTSVIEQQQNNFKKKTMNSKTTTKSQLSTSEPERKKKKEKQRKQKLSKQLEQEQNQRNGHHMEGFQWERGREEWGEKVQGRRSMIGRHKIDGKRLKWYRKQKSKNLYVQHMDMN